MDKKRFKEWLEKEAEKENLKIREVSVTKNTARIAKEKIEYFRRVKKSL